MQKLASFIVNEIRPRVKKGTLDFRIVQQLPKGTLGMMMLLEGEGVVKRYQIRNWLDSLKTPVKTVNK